MPEWNLNSLACENKKIVSSVKGAAPFIDYLECYGEIIHYTWGKWTTV
ncbi:MAG: hypothetical protein Kow0089_01690 [Desulfobulbaceae bacterium]